jgi:pyrroloquinoline quinone biosynthesis protein D
MSDELRVPCFPRGSKFRFDDVRGAWVLLAPEKLFMPDAVAVEILHLVDGSRTIAAIADDLAGRFTAPRAVIARDVTNVLEGLAARGAVKL